jgi:hypothetical protein
MRKAGITIEGVNGEIPVAVVLKLGASGITMLSDARVNPYSLMRFGDQHPLISGRSFLSIDSITSPWVSIAPFAGNLEVDQNIVSLRQFEMGVRGGRVTGDCILDWEGLSSSLELRLRATGVKSSHGEPFDANTAIVISARDRNIEGRAEVVRIGKRHLLDLLDFEDPARTDAAMNRVRGALTFGYPERVRIAFNHGFASARVDLGGLASLVSIGELRGIPIGPLIDRVLSRLARLRGSP